MFDEINKIMSEWDPIGVGYPLSLSEYKQYTPMIISLMPDKTSLEHYFIELLGNMGLDFDPNNHSHQQDVQMVVERILAIKNKS